VVYVDETNEKVTVPITFTLRDENRQLHAGSNVVAPNFQTRAAAWTPDEGRTWFKLPGVSGYRAVAFANPKAGWFVGNGGEILKISF
jgi:hypothetical protein